MPGPTISSKSNPSVAITAPIYLVKFNLCLHTAICFLYYLLAPVTLRDAFDFAQRQPVNHVQKHKGLEMQQQGFRNNNCF